MHPVMRRSVRAVQCHRSLDRRFIAIIAAARFYLCPVQLQRDARAVDRRAAVIPDDLPDNLTVFVLRRIRIVIWRDLVFVRDRIRIHVEDLFVDRARREPDFLYVLIGRASCRERV